MGKVAKTMLMIFILSGLVYFILLQLFNYLDDNGSGAIIGLNVISSALLAMWMAVVTTAVYLLVITLAFLLRRFFNIKNDNDGKFNS